MRKHHVFNPNGCDRLEARIAPSAVGVAPAVQVARVDAHVQHAKVHRQPKTHRQPKVHHQVHPLPRQTVHHENHLGGGTAGGGTVGGGTGGGGYYGGGYY